MSYNLKLPCGSYGGERVKPQIAIERYSMHANIHRTYNADQSYNYMITTKLLLKSQK